MTKQEAIQKLYGENPPFVYDTALPIKAVDSIIDKLMDQPGFDRMTDVWKHNRRQEYYTDIIHGSVYAYQGKNEGFLPLTQKAYNAFLWAEMSIFVPLIED